MYSLSFFYFGLIILRFRIYVALNLQLSNAYICSHNILESLNENLTALLLYVRAGFHSISRCLNTSIRKIFVNRRDYISTSISISVNTRNGTFSIFLCLCLCWEYLSVNRAYVSIIVSIKSFLVSGIHKNKIQAHTVRICQLKTWRRRWTKRWRNLSVIILVYTTKNQQTLKTKTRKG